MWVGDTCNLTFKSSIYRTRLTWSRLHTWQAARREYRPPKKTHKINLFICNPSPYQCHQILDFTHSSSSREKRTKSNSNGSPRRYAILRRSHFHFRWWLHCLNTLHASFLPKVYFQGAIGWLAWPIIIYEKEIFILPIRMTCTGRDKGQSSMTFAFSGFPGCPFEGLNSRTALTSSLAIGMSYMATVVSACNRLWMKDSPKLLPAWIKREPGYKTKAMESSGPLQASPVILYRTSLNLLRRSPLPSGDKPSEIQEMYKCQSLKMFYWRGDLPRSFPLEKHAAKIGMCFPPHQWNFISDYLWAVAVLPSSEWGHMHLSTLTHRMKSSIKIGQRESRADLMGLLEGMESFETKSWIL